MSMDLVLVIDEIVLGGRPIGVASGVARAAEFRCNMAAGAAAFADAVTEAGRVICARVQQHCPAPAWTA
jgi:glutathione synthase/RimK-type ligase-like ATP-grasp enzyme